jgi:hydrogenase maturation protein HypF
MAEHEGLACVKIQHHKAHFAALLGEHHLAGSQEPVLGVIWDGTGLGEDGQLWGGEFFVANGGTMKRAGHLPAIPVLSGDKMARDPRLSALSALSGSCYQADAWLKPLFSATEWDFYTKLRKQPHRLYTTSAGRLFDAAAALTGICPVANYEGEAALRLEAAASRIHRHAPAVAALIREWVAAHPGSPMEVLCAALEQEWPAANVAYAFHVAMVRLIAEEAAWHQIKRVAFSGGVFQNALLCSLIRQTMASTFDLFFHTELPPNDASIPYGQMVYVAHYQVSDIAIPSHEIPERIPRS